MRGADTVPEPSVLARLVLELARGALGPDPHGDRAEFVRLAALARELVEEDGS
jgi:hypothetical protein